MAAFFGIFAVLMLGVKSSRDPRSHIQNGFWFFKYLLLGLLIFGFFYIGDKSLSTRNFIILINLIFVHMFLAMMWIGMIGAFLFILIQLVN